MKLNASNNDRKCLLIKKNSEIKELVLINFLFKQKKNTCKLKDIAKNSSRVQYKSFVVTSKNIRAFSTLV